MYGAILGDIVGSPYEFVPCKRTDIPLFCGDSRFTDDTVMTVAVAQALLTCGEAPLPLLQQALVHTMREWGRQFPRAGYGGSFRRWLRWPSPQPYGSYGNGAAMRVSPVGWLYDDLPRTLQIAQITAAVTHDHPEGIRGAQAVAAAIFLARTGSSKDKIRRWLQQHIGYDLSQNCDDIRPHYAFCETCQGSVPQSIIAFLDSDSFAQALRLAVSLGGDADTMACIAGSIAEAYYGIPPQLQEECRARIPASMQQVTDAFYAAVSRQSLPGPDGQPDKGAAPSNP